MRVLVFAAVLLLAGCGATVSPPRPVVSYVPEPMQREYHPHHNKNTVKIERTKPQPEVKIAPEIKVAPAAPIDLRPWDISEDRFITTHEIWRSSEALHRSQDEIKARLKELDKPSTKIEQKPEDKAAGK